MRSLTLLIPDLLATLNLMDEQDTSLPTLRTLLQHPHRNTTGYDDEPSAFYRYLGQHSPLPKAELLAHMHRLPPSEGWLVAEPIECQMDLKAVYCLGNQHLYLNANEATSFIESINEHIVPSGRRMFAPSPNQWLMALDKPVKWQTRPLKQILNQKIDTQTPYDLEMQMLLHNHPVNKTRQARKMPTANAVWFSGAGKLPFMDKRPSLGVVTDDAMTKTLAEWVEAQVCAPLGSLEQCLDKYLGQNDVQDLVIGLHADENLHNLEHNWVEPLLSAVKDKRLKDARIYCGDDLCYDVERKVFNIKIPFV